MRNIFLLAVNTLKVTFRKRGNIIVYLLLPVLGVIVSLGLYSNSATGSTNLGIVNRDIGVLSKDMENSLKSVGNFKVFSITESEIDNTLLDGKVSCVLIIPEGFTEGIYKRNPVKAEIVSVKGQETTVWVEKYVEFYSKNVYDIAEASNGNRDIFNKMYESYKNQDLTFKVEKVGDQAKNKLITAQTLGFLIMFVMLGANMTSEAVLKEKRNRTYFRICSAPVSSKIYILGNVLANISIVLVQIVILLLVMTRFFHVNTFVPDLQMALILGIFGIVAIALGMVIVSFSSSSYQSGTLSTLIITPTCMLGGCFWPIDFMPDIMKKISYFMPQRWALDAVQKIQRGGSIENIVIHLAVLLAFAAALFVISAYKFATTDNVRKFV